MNTNLHFVTLKVITEVLVTDVSEFYVESTSTDTITNLVIGYLTNLDFFAVAVNDV